MKQTLIDTLNFCGRTYSDYLDYCEECAITPQGENSNHYWSWLSETTTEDIDAFFGNLEFSKSDSRPCRVSGSLGLWWGRPEIKPERHESLSGAVRKCVSNCDDFSVVLEDGKIQVSAYHHDGCNNFVIAPILGRYPKYLF